MESQLTLTSDVCLFGIFKCSAQTTVVLRSPSRVPSSPDWSLPNSLQSYPIYIFITIKPWEPSRTGRGFSAQSLRATTNSDPHIPHARRGCRHLGASCQHTLLVHAHDKLYCTVKGTQICALLHLRMSRGMTRRELFLRGATTRMKTIALSFGLKLCTRTGVIAPVLASSIIAVITVASVCHPP